LRRYGPVEPLATEHDVAAFDCGPEAQTAWLRRHAVQASRSDTAKVYVVCRAGTRSVVGYYALAAGSVGHDGVPPRITQGLGRYPIPVILLTRLGVDTQEQGKGLGSALVRDALLQTASVAEKVRVRALLIHAETPEAAEFYRRISPAFESSPTDPLHLILLMKDLRTAIREAAAVSRE
jgi:GNAT superfamily N-acetyltransferase